jgi:hypothetical protein
LFYGICNLSSAPLRAEPSDKSEMISQLLFGESFIILEKETNWSKVKITFDSYEGFIDNKQFTFIPEEFYTTLTQEAPKYSGEIVDFVTNDKNELTTIPLGANLPLLNDGKLQINASIYLYDGSVIAESKAKSEILNMAFTYLNSPYLWGGKTPFGIDCSGFTQMVYKLCGYKLFRDATEQAKQGEVLSFIEESEPGDLAFFDDEEGNIIHVGIILNNYKIIHSYGKVRIDILDHSGIFNADLQKHTHQLRVIKKVI